MSLRIRPAAPFAALFLAIAPLATLALIPINEARAGDLADEADLHFELGTTAFRNRDYKGALEHFLASNRLVPNRNAVANIAATYAALKQYPEAFRYYTQALEAEPDPSEKLALQAELDRITPKVAVLQVDTFPPGATVYIDRKDLGPRGQSPAVLGFTQSKVKVLVEDEGYENAESEPIDLEPGVTTRVFLKLVRVVGTVKLTGNPYGALVTVENFPDIGCALPCELQLPPGRRTLQVHKEGYLPAYRRVEVPAKSSITADFQMAPVTGGLVVNADERGATVEVDGHLVGFTPAVLDVPVGERKVVVSLRGFQTSESAVKVVAGEQTKLEVSLAPVEEISAVSRTAEKLDDAPSSVTVISNNELRAMGYPTLTEALRGVRGIFINDDGTYQSVGVRGYGPASGYGNTVLILVDGHPTNDDWADSSYAGYDGRTDLEDIDHIEVVRGPGSVVYGTGAFVGVINLVTKAHAAPREVSATLGTTESGSAKARAAAHQPINDNSGFDLSIAGLDANRAGQFFVLQPDGTFAWEQASDQLRSGTAAGKFWYGAFTLQGQAVARTREYPIAEDYINPPAQASSVIDRRSFVEARFEPKLGQYADLLLRTSYDRYSEDALTVYTGESSYTRFIGDWVDGEARITLRPIGNLRLMLGGEAQDHFHVSQEGVTTTTDGAPPQTFLNYETPFRFYAGYLLADYSPIPQLHFSAGARLDSYSTFGSSLNPRLALIWKPDDDNIVKIMAGSAFRAPSIYELYENDGGISQVPACASASQGCSPLLPETIRSAEIEYTRHFATFWTALGSAWGSIINNTIELEQAPNQPVGITQYQNTGAPIDGLGGEVELRREWRQGWMFELNASLQKLWFDQSGNSDPTTLLGQVPNSPSVQGGAKLAVPLVARYLTLMTRVSIEGPRWDRDDEPGDPIQRRTPAGVIWDAVLSGELPDWHLRGTLGIYNLADWQYQLPLSKEFGAQNLSPQAGRRLLATATFTF